VEKEQERARVVEILKKLVNNWDAACKIRYASYNLKLRPTIVIFIYFLFGERDELGLRWEELQLRHNLLTQNLTTYGGLEVTAHYEKEHNKRVHAEIERLQLEYEQESANKRKKLADDFEQEFAKAHEIYNKRKITIDELIKDTEILEKALKEGEQASSKLQSSSTKLEKELAQLRDLVKKAGEVHHKQKANHLLAVRLSENKKKNQDLLQLQDETIARLKELLGIQGDLVDSSTVMLDEEIIRYRTLLELADFKLSSTSNPSNYR